MSKPRHLIYAGRRIDGEKLLQEFIDGKELRHFTGIKSCIIGRAYEAKPGSEAGRLSISVRPQEVEGFEASEAEILKWEALDAIAGSFRRRKAMAQRFAREPRFLKAAKALEPLCAGLSFSETRQLIEFIIDTVQKKGAKK